VRDRHVPQALRANKGAADNGVRRNQEVRLVVGALVSGRELAHEERSLTPQHHNPAFVGDRSCARSSPEKTAAQQVAQVSVGALPYRVREDAVLPACGKHCIYCFEVVHWTLQLGAKLNAAECFLLNSNTSYVQYERPNSSFTKCFAAMKIDNGKVR